MLTSRTLRLLLLMCLALHLAAARGLAQVAPAPPAITLQDALTRARASNQTYLSAAASAAIAKESRIQSKAALLPSASFNNSYVFTQSNGTDHGVYVGADGVNVYTSQAVIHGETLSIGKRREYQKALAAEAVARARQDIALRGLSATVIQNYFAIVASERKRASSELSLEDARRFVEITGNLERGGEVARADVVKARILLEQRQRDVQEALLAVEKARIGLAILIFPDAGAMFGVVDDLLTISALAPLTEIQAKSLQASPDLRAAQGALKEETSGVSLARSEFLPSLSFDYFYGINANRFAVSTDGVRNLGSSVQLNLNVPLFNFGATRSRIPQAELRRQQAQLDVSLTLKELTASLNILYREAQTARTVIDSLKASLDLAAESLRLTLLRYQAGEVGVLDVVDAQATLTESRSAYDEGLARYRTVWANLELLAGNL